MVGLAAHVNTHTFRVFWKLGKTGESAYNSFRVQTKLLTAAGHSRMVIIYTYL